jgi:hypothetical protein
MVTDENFGDLLIEGLEEAAAHQRGEGPWVKTVRRLTPPRPGTSTDDEPDTPPSLDRGPRNRLLP